MLETLYAEICQSGRVSNGAWVTLSANFKHHHRRRHFL